MEGVNEVPFKHNSAVVQIETNIAKHEHISWFPEGYTKGNTVPSQSVYIFGNYDPMEYDPTYKDGKTQLAYKFKIPYLKIVDDMLNFNMYSASIVKFNEKSKFMSKIYLDQEDNLNARRKYGQIVLKIKYYDEKLRTWVDGEFKKGTFEIGIHITYYDSNKKVS